MAPREFVFVVMLLVDMCRFVMFVLPRVLSCALLRVVVNCVVAGVVLMCCE